MSLSLEVLALLIMSAFVVGLILGISLSRPRYL